MKYLAEYENFGIQCVSHLGLILKYFQRSHVVSKHNQARQFRLELKKSRLLKSHTSCINISDCYKLAYYLIRNENSKIAGLLSC
jgi:hypothetical protein